MSLAAAGLSAESNNPQTLEEGAEEAAAKEDEESVEHLYGLSSHQDSNCVTFIASLLPFSSSKYVPSRHGRIDSSRHLEKIFSLPSVRFSTRPVTAHYFARNQSLRHSPLPLDCKKERTSQYFMQINIYLGQTSLPLFVPHLQLAVFFFRSFTRRPAHSVDVGFQDIMPSATSLSFRSIWNKFGNCTPLLPTVPLYCILQCLVVVYFPFILTCRRRSMLVSKILCHLLEHCFIVRPGTRVEIAPHSLPPCL
jgi:hypothetical protein